MKEILTTITTRGQVTVPVEVRRRLGLKPHDKVAFTIDDAEVRLRPVAFSLESVFGSVEPLSTTTDLKQIERDAWEEKVGHEVQVLKSQCSS